MNENYQRILQICKDIKNALSEAQDYRVLEALDKLALLLTDDKDFEEQVVHVKRQLYQIKLPNIETDQIAKNNCANAILHLCNLIEKRYKNIEESASAQFNSEAKSEGALKLREWIASNPSNYIVLILFLFAHVASQVLMEDVDFGLFIALLNIMFSIYCIWKTKNYIRFFSKDSYVTNKEIDYANYLNIEFPCVTDNAKDNWSFFKYRANEVLSQFSFYWKSLWVTWICFYVVHFLGLMHKYNKYFVKP